MTPTDGLLRGADIVASTWHRNSVSTVVAVHTCS